MLANIWLVLLGNGQVNDIMFTRLFYFDFMPLYPSCNHLFSFVAFRLGVDLT